jgi:Zn-dependent M28 family amino/carboxypeptidase
VELLRSIKAAPLAKHTLVVLFFDLEEGGLGGSRAYLERLGADARPAYAINLDIFAYGDSLFATASNPDGPLLRALRGAATSAGLPVRDAPISRYPGSDHQSMAAAGLDTLGLALVDTADIDGVLKTGPVDPTKLGSGPRILSIIHSPHDTMDEARVEDVAKGIRVLEQLIRTLDASDH